MHLLRDAFPEVGHHTGLKIIGCGTADRGDDAAGLLVVRRLRELGFDACEHASDGLALMESWSGAETVILIDAVVTGDSPGTLSVWDSSAAPIATDALRGSTHAFGVGEAIRLARILGRMPSRLVICGIEARSFEIGSAPCDAVRNGSNHLAAELAHMMIGR